MNAVTHSRSESDRETRLPELLRAHEEDLLAEWAKQQRHGGGSRSAAGRMSERELNEQSSKFLAMLREAAQATTDINAPAWQDVRGLLGELSRSRAVQGFTPKETATFVFSLKRPIFDRLRREFSRDPEALARETWLATEMLDELGLYTTEVFQKTREEIIKRQQQELLELSTPVTRLWDGVLAVPLIGTLDSARTQVVMESLLSEIVETGASIAIIDITGVPTVDTLVAQHLLKTVSAARLMGAECIISGIRPQIAQTIVHLGVGLGDIVTKASMAEALKVALQRRGLSVGQIRPADGAMHMGA